MLVTVAELLTAAAAVGALIAAIWAARVSRNLYRIEAARDFESGQRAEKEQASGIAAWCVYSRAKDVGGILLHNSSDAPVFDVEVRSTYARKQNLPAELQAPLKLSLLPPGDYVADADAKFNWSFPEPRESIDDTVRPITKNSQWIVKELYFTDAHGTRWVRVGGTLTKVAPATA